MCRVTEGCDDKQIPQDECNQNRSDEAVDGEQAAIEKPNLPRPVNQTTELDLDNSFSIFLFDWDDSFFPTSELVTLGPERLREALDWVNCLVMLLLEAAVATPQSRVVILTNASLEWVHRGARDFLPGVASMLKDPASRVSLVSAHHPRSERPDPVTDLAAYEAAVARWKIEAVHPLAVEFQEALEHSRARTLQVVSIGDSPHDLEAAHALSGMLRSEESFVKTVLMKSKPTGSELVGQLRALKQAFVPLTRLARSVHQSMRQPQEMRAEVVRVQNPVATAVAAVPALATEPSIAPSSAVPAQPAQDALGSDAPAKRPVGRRARRRWRQNRRID